MKMGGYKLVAIQGKKKVCSWGKSTAPARGGDSSSPQRRRDIRSIYEAQHPIPGKMRIV